MKILRPEVEADIPNSGGIFELMDMTFLPLFNCTADEMDLMADCMTDAEIDETGGLETFTEKRKALEYRNKYVPHYGGSGKRVS